MRHRLVKQLTSRIQKLAGESDSRLVEKAQDGDGRAYGRLYLKYLDAIFRYIYFKVDQNRSLAEDIAEAAFVKAYENLDRFDPEKGTFKAWLYQITRNTVYDYYRTHKPTSPLEYALNRADDRYGPEQLTIDNYHLKDIKNAMTELTAEQKEIIELAFIEGYENAEIEEILDKSSDAVRALKYRAIKQLKEKVVTE